MPKIQHGIPSHITDQRVKVSCRFRELDVESFSVIRMNELTAEGDSFIDLSSNKLSGDVGMEMFSSMKGLGVNEFPVFLRKLDKLYALDLSNNKIYGQIPYWVKDFSRNPLRYLYLSDNFLTGGIENLQHFNQTTVLDLNSNLLQGPLPLSICNLSSPAILDFSGNNFTSCIPECLLLLKGLTVLDLGSNNFQGSIPTSPVQGNNTLRILSLSANQLEGRIPRSLINFTVLGVLDLGNNKITDTFPTWLETLPYLWVLILRHNRFHGPMALRGICFLFLAFGSLTYLIIVSQDGNLDLCGFPLLKDCGEISAKHVPPSSMPQQKDGSEDLASIFSWRDVLMGCGCGLVFGFIMGLVMLRIAKPEWLINISECCYQKLKRR
ncbi:hypothetical protein BC332_18361 [Capsicum chinense]|nr:hypothetical protein BC332_18361 [Capsicum chinense]